MPDPSRQRDRAGRRAKRFLTPAEKYQAFVQVLSGEMTVAQCAEHWGVDRSTIMKAREVAKQGALTALAVSKPAVRADGADPELVAARHEIARLSEALKEMAVKVTLLEEKSVGGDGPGAPAGRRTGQDRAVGPGRPRGRGGLADDTGVRGARARRTPGPTLASPGRHAR
jgi:transposase